MTQYSFDGRETILVTGGAGFIGSSVVRYLLSNTHHVVVTLDKLTYAGNKANLASFLENDRLEFIVGDIIDRQLVRRLIEKFDVKIIMHLAAESHVDRSIDSPEEFVNSNIVGTFALLEEFRCLVRKHSDNVIEAFRFCHISTDEVFGSLGQDGAFDENSPYDPSSPYSASKAAADHLARAWARTYGLPIIVTNCSNNYGPCQHPEKLIPLTILNAMQGKPLPIYGDGSNVRDWLYVEDHAHALFQVATTGRSGETYNIGSRCERTNLQVVCAICDVLDRLHPKSESYRSLIEFVTDRPGHDQRYAVDPTKIERDLGWYAGENFQSGIEKTVEWYLQNSDWVTEIENSRIRRGLSG